jgi:hypothetical protein
MVNFRSRALNMPAKTGCSSLMLQNTFRQWTAANISQAYHQNFHAAKLSQFELFMIIIY